MMGLVAASSSSGDGAVLMSFLVLLMGDGVFQEKPKMIAARIKLGGWAGWRAARVCCNMAVQLPFSIRSDRF
jgi:hypothetical protein